MDEHVDLAGQFGQPEWFVTTLCAAEMDAARRAGLNPYGFIDREVGEIGLDDPVTFLPFLVAGNPMGIDARAVSGLRAWHKRGHLLRGIYEGIAFNHRIHCDPLIEAFAVEDIRWWAAGVTQSSIWPQLFADTMGKPIQIPVGGEGGALGTAMVAAVGIGRFANLTEASEAMGTTTTTVEPTEAGTEPDAAALRAVHEPGRLPAALVGPRRPPPETRWSDPAGRGPTSVSCMSTPGSVVVRRRAGGHGLRAAAGPGRAGRHRAGEARRLLPRLPRRHGAPQHAHPAGRIGLGPAFDELYSKLERVQC